MLAREEKTTRSGCPQHCDKQTRRNCTESGALSWTHFLSFGSVFFFFLFVKAGGCFETASTKGIFGRGMYAASAFFLFLCRFICHRAKIRSIRWHGICLAGMGIYIKLLSASLVSLGNLSLQGTTAQRRAVYNKSNLLGSPPTRKQPIDHRWETARAAVYVGK